MKKFIKCIQYPTGVEMYLNTDFVVKIMPLEEKDKYEVFFNNNYLGNITVKIKNFKQQITELSV